MSVEDIHIPVMYEQLEDIQDDFDQVDVELSKFFLFSHPLNNTAPSCG